MNAPRHRPLATCLLLSAALLTSVPVLAAPPFAEFVDPNPNPGNQFGAVVLPLSTGNVVITSPNDDAGGTNAGAVYLFNGATGALISTLRGSTTDDQVGGTGVTVLSSGNYLVVSQGWSNGAGAVTWCSGTSGVNGTVSSSNSLVGVGSGAVTVLTNGNYVVSNPGWHNGPTLNVGAVTWGSGTSGVSGVVSSSNSLVGTTAFDDVGSVVTALTNGNYVVTSYFWDNGAATNAGAVTWGNGTVGTTGAVSAGNSLVGTAANSRVGFGGVTKLSNGNYVVNSWQWGNGTATTAGAVTWGSGTSGVSGPVSSSNSLVGSTAGDTVGFAGAVTALSNGNYVVRSRNWDNGAVVNVGAVTWGSGTSGVTGAVSSSNSLIGSKAGDSVGTQNLTELTNGNYVVTSATWDNGAIFNAGAVTWGSGTTGVTGLVSSANSLVGTSSGDNVGSGGVVALSNGNYVVRSQAWDNGAILDAGAVTWGNGSGGISGVVSSNNSLVGTTNSDLVGVNGEYGVLALNNGNYIVASAEWDNGTATNAGAVTWGNGTSGVSGAVSSSNSLVGVTSNDGVGSGGVIVLSTGNYLILSPSWDNGAATNAGAVTWNSGSSGVSGALSSSNSLVGSTANDGVGGSEITTLSNGNYVVKSPLWNSGGTADVGAVTWGSGSSGVSGAVSSSNSLVGSSPSDNVGSDGVQRLTNGNYVVNSSSWDNGGAANVGAVTWANGVTGVTGAVSVANSVVGGTSGSSVGSSGVVTLSSGNYVILTSGWNNDMGAVTWVDGASNSSFVVSSSNSLVGTAVGQRVGSGGVTELGNGHFVVSSPDWDNGAVVSAGALTWGSGTTGISGALSASNSLVGLTANTNLQPVVVDTVNLTYLGSFPAEGAGKVRLASQVDGSFFVPPEVDVQGNGLFIANGDSSPSLGDHTDFGPVLEGGGTRVVAYTIRNHGAAPLTLTGTPKVAVGGIHVGDFTVNLQPTSPIPPGGNAIFQVTFDPSAAGLRSATLNITSDYTALSPYEFAIQGTGASSAQLFANAMTAAGLGGGNALATATPQNDGITNLEKYAFNLDLLGRDRRTLTPGTGTAGLPVITFPSAGVMRMEYLRRIGSGLIYSPKKGSSPQPGSWQNLSTPGTVTPIDANWERVHHDEPFTPGSTPAMYGTVEVTLP